MNRTQQKFVMRNHDASGHRAILYFALHPPPREYRNVPHRVLWLCPKLMTEWN